MLKNGSFEDGWTNLPPAPGNLINQQPNGWMLSWSKPGESLFGSGDKASQVPECLHKPSNTLPAHEQRGKPGALILDGDVTYKVFHRSGSFGAELRQTVTGLAPGSTGKLTVPIIVGGHADGDVWAAESGVWVNGEGQWVNAGDMGDRRWYRHQLEFSVPDSGQIDIAIRFKSKWDLPKDFFIDDVRLESVEAGEGGVKPPSEHVVTLSLPAGWEVMTETGQPAGQVRLAVPDGTHVEVMKR